MNKLFLVLSFLALFSFSVHAGTNPIEAQVSVDYPIHNLNSGLNYTAIQQAINAKETSNGDTIFIEHGTYVGGIVVNKSLSLIGEDPETTIIDGMGVPDQVIKITADNVSIAGFTIRNSSRTAGAAYSGGGIAMYNVKNCTIHANVIADNVNGITLESSSNTNINNNSLVSNSQRGISLLSSSSNTISENTFVNDGLYILPSDLPGIPFNNEVVNNTVNGKPLVYLENESGYLVENAGQVVLIHCNGIQVKNNDMSNCSVGIELWRTSDSEINVNNITGNEYGVLMEAFTNNTICQNNISNSTYGIYGYLSSNNSLNQNALVSNYYGIFSGDAKNDSIGGNNIANCSFGMELILSLNCHVYGNNITNGIMGIDLFGASNNTLKDNVLVNNSHGGFAVEAASARDDFVNYVDTSNTIDGKPIIYLVNKQDLVIDPKAYPSIGYLAVVNSTNMTIEDLALENSTDGIVLAWVTDSLVDKVTVVGNFYGIYLVQSTSNAIEDSIIMDNENGIVLLNSSINNVTSNSIMENEYGIMIDHDSSENRFYHNNFVENTEHVVDSLGWDSIHANYWDDGYPSGGNYWSGYTSSDIYSGQFQNETGHDWIWDSPYFVLTNNKDNYPLVKPFDAETQNVWLAYRNLLSQYNGMQSEFEALNLTTHEQQRSFNDLTTFLNSSLIVLQAQINSLNQTNTSLNQVVADLQGQLNSINSTLQTSLNQIKEQNDSLSYQTHTIITIFGAVIILLFVVTIFFATRKPKTK
jgi:parallel beta-helix repeat protein